MYNLITVLCCTLLIGCTAPAPTSPTPTSHPANTVASSTVAVEPTATGTSLAPASYTEPTATASIPTLTTGEVIDVAVSAADLTFEDQRGYLNAARLRARIHNNSAPGVSIGVWVRFLVDGKVVNELPCFLGSRETAELSTPYQLPLWPHRYINEPKDLTMAVKYQVVVDPENRITEADESNNEATALAQIKCGGLKDTSDERRGGPIDGLSISAADIRMGQAAQGNTAWVYWTVRNATRNPVVRIKDKVVWPYVDGALLNEKLDGEREGSAEYFVAHLVPFNQLTPLSFRVGLGSNHTVAGAGVRRTVPVIAHDAAVHASGLSWSPSPAKPGARLTLKAVVHNTTGLEMLAKDPLKFPPPLRVRMLIDGNVVSEQHWGPSGSALTREFTAQYTVPVDRTIPLAYSVVVDPYDLLTEDQEGNNQAQVSIPVVVTGQTSDARPDFGITSADMGFAPRPVIPGKSLMLWASPRNKSLGNLPASSKLRVLFKVDGQVIYDTSISAAEFPSQQHKLLQKTWQVPKNQIKDPVFEVVLDPESRIPEADRGDNTASIALPMARSDLWVPAEGLGSSPSPPLFGQTVKLTATVLNDGLGQANDSRVRFEIDGEAIGEQVVTVAPGGFATAQVDWPVPASFDQPSEQTQIQGHSGQLGLPAEPSRAVAYRVSVDPDNVLEELNEENNSASSTLQVRLPRKTGTVYVVVQDNTRGESNETPAEGVQVTLRSGNTSVSAVTDRTGWCTFYGVPFGRFDVSASRTGFRGAEATGSLPNYAWSQTVDLRINNRGTVAGTVTSMGQGGAVALGEVAIHGGGLSLLTPSEGVDKGKFSMSLPPGQHTLVFSKDGYKAAVKQVTVDPLGQHVLDVSMEATTYALVRGTVYDEAGNPISGANVIPSVTRQGIPVAQPGTHTDANGEYLLQVNLPDGLRQWAYLQATKAGLPGGVGAEEMVRGREYVVDIVMRPPGYTGSRNASTDVSPWTIIASMPDSFWSPEYKVMAAYGRFRLSASVQVEDSVIRQITCDTQPDYWYYFGVSSDWHPAEVFTSDEIGKTPQAEKMKAAATLAVAVMEGLPLAAAGRSSNLTRVVIQKIALESNGAEVWAAYLGQEGSVTVVPDTQVNWNNFRVKFYVQVDPTGSGGGEGFEPANPLAGYGRDKVLLKWDPRRDPTNKPFTKITTYLSEWNDAEQRFEYTDSE